MPRFIVSKSTSAIDLGSTGRVNADSRRKEIGFSRYTSLSSDSHLSCVETGDRFVDREEIRLWVSSCESSSPW